MPATIINEQEDEKFHPITAELWMVVLEALANEKMTKDMAIPPEFHINMGKAMDKIVRDKLAGGELNEN